MKDKLILTDADGVLLHWEWMFDRWMKKHGYNKLSEGSYGINECYGLVESDADRLVSMFNETVYIRSLPPYLDAIKYVKRLHEEYGAVFHVITSIGDDSFVAESRIKNLYEVFGRSVFYKIDCLNPCVSKQTILQQYKDSELYWLEDHPKNYAIGQSLGLSSRLFDQHYNRDYTAYNRVYSWKEFYLEYSE